MKAITYLFLVLLSICTRGQVGINTETPEATLEVVGKPTDINHFDGIIPPRVTGDQLALKFYSNSKKGAIVFVTKPPLNLTKQVVNITEAGPYFFDGKMWNKLIESQDLNSVTLKGNTSSVKIILKDRLCLDFDDNENYILGNSNGLISGVYNSVIGTDSKITSGNGNAAIAYAMSQSEVKGKLNFGAGVSALNGTANQPISGNRNIGIGPGAMSYLTSGNDNIAIGYLSGAGNRTGSNNIFIGIGAGSPAVGDRSVNNKLAIHSTPVTTSSSSFWDSITNNYTDYKFALISGDFSERWLNINGKLSITPSQMPIADGDTSYTKKVVAKEDGSFGFAKEIIPPPPVNGTYVLKSVNGIVSWSIE